MSSSSSSRYVMDTLEPRVLLSGRVVGYFPEYRWSTFGSIDWNAVTHVNYFSLSANSTGSLSTSNINLSHMATLVSTAHANDVTVSITIGPQSFATIASNSTALNNFVNNIVQFATTNNLDGIDLDWEPTPTGSNITLYGNLIDALYTQAQPQGLLLTAAVNPLNKEIPLAATAKMDWLNVMCYDFAPNNHSPYTSAVNAMNGWASYGVPKSKLVMGVPFYGRQGTTWQDTMSRTYGAIINDYFVANGSYPSPDLDFLNGWHFNGKTTIGNKAQFVVNNNFGGVMIWELGQDHFVSGQYTTMSLLPVIKNIILPPGDTTPPTVVQADFLFATSPHKLTFQFSENVGPSVSLADIVVRDIDTQAQILLASGSYNSATDTVTYTFNGIVPDGRYRATLSGSGILDAAGNPMGEDYTFDFFFLAGDPNHDGSVNLTDFNIMATNFGLPDRTFAQGDTNYDGMVNLQDFNTISATFGTTLFTSPLLRGSSAAGASRPLRADSLFSASRISSSSLNPDRINEEDQQKLPAADATGSI